MQRVVAITGASSGIGAELARQLGARGDRLVLAARRQAELEAVARQSGSETLVVPTDVTRRSDVERLRDRALERFGAVDVWVNNAGRGITKPVLELTDEEFDEMMAVNVKSAIYGMQAIAPHFLERRRGHILNVSSMLGRVPFATYRSAYNAAKHALNALTANARVDLQRQCADVHVTLVIPGLVATEFGKHALHGSPPPPAMGAQSAADVAASIAGAIDAPVAEVYTNPQHPALALRYFQDVAAFEQEQRR
ncbi:MAG TPA: SDR family NAD(P)-dependent oxidoreductase [Vicinamibacterales bacterium]|nr:SDR family NAD(P)-dependent oxidoreductase [Vicinamibacterales bacterium]